MDKLQLETPNIVDENVEAIEALFPNCITEVENDEGKIVKTIDFDLLKQELSHTIVDGAKERYQLTWPGKYESLLLANSPITKTLRPCREESVDFDNTQNLFIEGDNLDVLKLLQKTYLGKVKMIYIDPPYNTGKDFIYSDKFKTSKEEHLGASGQTDKEGNRLMTNTESNGRFHSDWLSMMYPRLRLARNLLRDDGAIFISIDDNEVHNLRKVCSEIFGETNFVSQIPRIAKRTSNKGTHFRPTKDYVVVYAKQITLLAEFGIQKKLIEDEYKFVEENGRKYKKSGASLYQPSLDSRPNQRYYIKAPDGSLIIPPGNVFPKDKLDAAKVKPVTNADKVWRWSVDTYRQQKHLLMFTKGSSKNPLLDENGKQSKWNIYDKVYYDEDTKATLHPEDVIYDYPNSQSAKELKALSIPFSFSKPTGLLIFLLKLVEDKNSLILDFFAGSATTAHAVMQFNAEDGGNRKYIMVQCSEPCKEKSEAFKAGFKTIADIGKERIRRAGRKIKEEYEKENIQHNLIDKNSKENTANLDIGFRLLKVDSSNIKEVYDKPSKAKQTEMRTLIDNIEAGRTPEDILFQILLDWGVNLSLPITVEKISGLDIFCVDGDALVACFAKDGKINEDLCIEIAKKKPLRVVFRDAGFENDSAKINVEQIFRLKSPSTEIKTI